MNKPHITSKQTFQMIPCEFINTTASIQSIYVYSKLTMLQNTWYSQSALGINPISKEKELKQQQVSDYCLELQNINFISISKQSVDGKDYNRNIYNILPIKGYWQAVMNDFINLTTLSAKEKGFAILLSLYRRFPASVNGISKLTGIAKDTVRKYISRLKEVGILSESYLLNPTYFPNLPEQAAKEKYILYKEELRKFTGNKALQKKIDWIDSKICSYYDKIELLTKAEIGLIGCTILDEHPELADIDL